MRNFLATLLLLCIASSTQLFAQQTDHILGELLVQFEPGSQPESIVKEYQRLNGQSTQLKIDRVVSEPLRIYLVSFDHGTVHEKLLKSELQRDRNISVAQFNHHLEERQTVPDDPEYNLQWYWKNTGQTGGTPGADVSAELAWDLTTGGETAVGQKVVVAVMENADRSHPEIVPNLWFNTAEIPGNGIDDDDNGYVDDFNGWDVGSQTDNITPSGHGTSVSGMIGAVGNNIQGVAGLNWNVEIMHVDYGSLNEANVIAAYTYPYVMRKAYNESGGSRGAFVVSTNASWGINFGNPADAPLWCSFYDSLGVEGVLNCGATANLDIDIDVESDLPTGCSSEYMVAVTATDHNDVRTFSGFGQTTIDVGAPGEDVYLPTSNGGYTTTSGTSFASPLVAGMIALMYSAPCSSLGAEAIADPAATAAKVRDAIFAGVDPVANLTTETVYGGRVNAYASMQLLLAQCGPCPAPFGVTADVVTDTEASISWTSTDSTLFTALRFREAGMTEWTDTILNVTSPYTFVNLTACTDYELQLEDTCADTISGWTDTFSFRTDGCCEAPDMVEVDVLNDTTALVSWNFVLAANSYNLVYSDEEGNVTQVDGLTETQLLLEDLMVCTEYRVSLQTVCDTGATNFGQEIIFETGGCGACTDFEYCPSEGEDASFEWIDSIAIDAFTNASGNNEGYAFFEDQDLTLATFGIYDFTLDVGYSGQTYDEWVKVFIDLNQDGEFDESAEIVYNSEGLFENQTSGALIVPGDALPGFTRMRVVMRWNNEPGACTPSFNYGEVEDYCVTIVEGEPPLCEQPTDLTATDVSFTSANLSWTGSAAAISYEVELRPVGTPTWTAITVDDDTALVLSGAQDCTEYEFRVRSICVGDTTDFTEPFLFTTECFPACDMIPTGLDTAVVNETSMLIVWDEVDIAENYTLRVRNTAEGPDDWTEYQSPNASETVGDLEACAEYEFQVRANCASGEGDYSEGVVRATDCLISTEDPNATHSLIVQPNPMYSETTFTLKGWNLTRLRFRLIDATGKVVRDREVERQFTVDRAELSAGIYFYQITNNGAYVTTGRLVVQ